MDTTNTKIFGNKNTSQLQHMGKSSANEGIQLTISFPDVISYPDVSCFTDGPFLDKERDRSRFTSPGLSSVVGFEI